MESSRRSRKRTRKSIDSPAVLSIKDKECLPQPLKKEKESPLRSLKKENDCVQLDEKSLASLPVKTLSSLQLQKKVDTPHTLRKSASPTKKIAQNQPFPHFNEPIIKSVEKTVKEVETIDLTTKLTMPSSNHLPSLNGDYDLQIKKLKKDSDIDMGRRNQPHRAARFTESYNAPVENVVISDEDKSKKKSGSKSTSSSSSSSSSEDSDSDCEIIPQSPKQPLTDEQQADWERRLHELQKQLCNEEVKLALFHKLKHSQEQKEEKKDAPPTPQPLPPHINSLNKARALKDITITTTTVDTSPTKKLLTNSSSSKRIQRTSHQDLKKTLPSNVRNDGPINLAITNEKPIITIQPVSTESKASTQVVSSNTNTNTVTVKNVTNVKNTPPPSSPVNNTINHQEKIVQEKFNKEMTAQQQAMAKVILRKQIEKTLLQIPTPKSITPDLHFVPSANPLEFIYYLGLDVVVDFITNTKKAPFCVEPFTCTECKTDFTPTWRTIKKHKSSRKQCVICNACFCYSTRHTLKNEHTARLRAALAKASQQEKELDRLSSGTSSSNIASLTNITPNYSLASSSENTSLSTSSPLVYNKATLSSSSSSRTTPTPPPPSPNYFLGNPNLFNLAAFAKLPHQLQAFIQAQAQSFMAANLSLPSHMIPFATPFIPPSYPFHLPNKSTSSQNDLQRQYLLDMIPSKRQN